MTNNKRCSLLIVSTLLFASLGLTALVADRVRSGQWVGTTIVGGKTYPTSSCVSPSDTLALNGDAKAVQGYLEKIIPPEISQDHRRQGRWRPDRLHRVLRQGRFEGRDHDLPRRPFRGHGQVLVERPRQDLWGPASRDASGPPASWM